VDSKVSLESRLNFEKVISSISSRFVGNINLDNAINLSFQELASYRKLIVFPFFYLMMIKISSKILMNCALMELLLK